MSGAPIVGAAIFGAALLGATPARAIINGAPDDAGAAHAAMVLNDRGGFCTGVFVDARTLLTAAHCVQGAAVRVMIDGALVAPQAIAAHPRYRAGAISAREQSIDLALVRLDRDAGAATALKSIAPPPAGRIVDARGFGLAIEGEPKSTGRYRRAQLAIATPYGAGRILIWAQSPDHQMRGACQGDSGGPMLDESGAVIAIISWSTGEGRRQCGRYTQGILLGPQRAWIDGTLGRWGAAAQWQ